MADLFPTRCNLCGGHVIFTSNAKIYGKEYGSGKCYLCMECGAYVGTHKPRPKEAFGILADGPMRKGKRICHDLFDSMWAEAKSPRQKRRELYEWLAGELDIALEDCHFGYFDLETLRKAYKALLSMDGTA